MQYVNPVLPWYQPPGHVVHDAEDLHDSYDADGQALQLDWPVKSW